MRFPPAPVVVDVVTPEIDPSVDAFFGKGIPQELRCANAFLFPSALSDTNDHLFLIIDVDIGVILGHIRKEMNGGIFVDEAVMPAVPEEIGIITTRKGNDTVEKIGTTVEEDDGMGRAKTATCSSQCQMRTM